MNNHATFTQNSEQPPDVNPTVDHEGTNISHDKTVDRNEAIQSEEINGNQHGRFNANTSTNISEVKQKIIVHNESRDQIVVFGDDDNLRVSLDEDLNDFPHDDLKVSTDDDLKVSLDEDSKESRDNDLKYSFQCDNCLIIGIFVPIFVVVMFSILWFFCLYKRKKNSVKAHEGHTMSGLQY